MENIWGDPAFSIVFHRVQEKRKENEKHRPQDLERSRERAVNSLKKTGRIIATVNSLYTGWEKNK